MGTFFLPRFKNPEGSCNGGSNGFSDTSDFRRSQGTLLKRFILGRCEAPRVELTDPLPQPQWRRRRGQLVDFRGCNRPVRDAWYHVGHNRVKGVRQCRTVFG